METINMRECAAAVGVKRLPGYGEKAYAEGIPIDAVVTDSRKVTPGCLFIALEGETFDGHDFIANALEKGAACALAHRQQDYGADRVLYVDNTLKAFQRLAGWYRSRFSVRMAGVTGSVGKTSTKEMIYAVLSSRYNTLKTMGNLNNEIGLPQTLLQLNREHEAAVVEMGMSGPGEIRELTLLARPDLAVITNVGVSHIEHLGSRENIRKAKWEITEGLHPGATVLLNGDNDMLQNLRSDDFRLVFYSIENPDALIRAKDVEEGLEETRFTICWEGREYPARIPCIGRHNVLNALAAFGVGTAFGIPPEQCAGAVERYQTTGMRQHIVRQGGYTVVEDCYNANPDSMKAALTTLREYRDGNIRRKIAVLADMLELGDGSPEMHRQAGLQAAQSGADLLFAYGEMSQYMAQAAREAGMEVWYYSPEEKGQLAKDLLAAMEPGDLIWFKGSRGMKLEEIIEQLYSSI